MTSLTDPDEPKHRLGLLCQKKHDFEGTGQSLRYVNDNRCVECTRARTRQWAAANKAKKRATDKAYRQANKEQISARQKEYHAPSYPAKRDQIIARRRERRASNKEHYRAKEREYVAANKERIFARRREYCIVNYERIKARQQRYRAANSEKYKLYLKEYYVANKGRHEVNRKRNYALNREKYLAQNRAYSNTEKGRLVRRHSHIKRKAAMKTQHRVPYTADQLRSRELYFNGQCAYCGKPLFGEIHIDHFLSLSLGGSDSLNNLLPSCPACNLSKNNSDPWKWYSRQAFFCPQRWDKILKTLAMSVE